MFTGIVTDVGRIRKLTPLPQGVGITIDSAYDLSTIAIGASISCNGVCLTVTDLSREASQNWFYVEAWEEALLRTNIKYWAVDSKINLERSLKIGDELGGHLVFGHIDGTAKILKKEAQGDAIRFSIQAPKDLSPFLAPKGSIALDGTSLTINDVSNNIFDVLIIKHTLAVTNWHSKEIGDLLNIEIDQLARYAARLLKTRL